MRLTTARRNGSSNGRVSSLFVATAFHEHGECRLDYMAVNHRVAGSNPARPSTGL